MKKFKIAQPGDADKITALRISAYKLATGTTIEDFSFLKWVEHDNKANIIYIENEEGEAISSIRATYVDQAEEMESLFDIRVHEPLEAPMILLDKATTDIQYRGLGFTGLMRYLFINSIINSDVKNLALTVNEGVSRIPQLKEIGFRFLYPDLSHRQKSSYNNSTMVLLSILNHQDFVKAKEISINGLKYPVSAYEFEEGFFDKMEAFVNRGALKLMV